MARLCRCERPLLDGETCLRCGRTPTLLPEPPLRKPRATGKTSWTQPGVVRALRAFSFFRGRAPAPGDWKQRMGDDWPPLHTVESLFGSLDAAMRAAGIEPGESHAVGE
jgi:hypothetical protein